MSLYETKYNFLRKDLSIMITIFLSKKTFKNQFSVALFVTVFSFFGFFPIITSAQNANTNEMPPDSPQSIEANRQQDSTIKNDPTIKSNKPGKLNSDIYEKEDDTKTLTGKVKIIRDMESVEVFLETKPSGPFLLKEGPSLGLFKERLIKSQKSSNRTVTIKIKNDYIESVELAPESKKPDSKENMDSVLDSIFKK